MGRDESDAVCPLPGPSQPGPSWEDAVFSPPYPGINRLTGHRSKRNPVFSPLCSVLIVAWLQAMPAHAHCSATASATAWKPVQLLAFTGSTERLEYMSHTMCTTYPLPSCSEAGCKVRCSPGHHCSRVGRTVATECRLS